LDKLDLAGDELTGIRVLQTAMVLPLLTVVYNSGSEPSLILQRIAEAGADATYNAVTDEIQSAQEAGIMDAAGTLEAVLRRAVSVATSLLTVDVAIVDPPARGPLDDRLDMSAKYE
jgi:chaperonin GroEL